MMERTFAFALLAESAVSGMLIAVLLMIFASLFDSYRE